MTVARPPWVCSVTGWLALLLTGCAGEVAPAPPASEAAEANAPGQVTARVTINGQTIEIKETEKEVVREQFKTGATPRVVVDVFNGKVHVTAGDGDGVQAVVTKTAGGATKEEAKANLKLIEVTFKQEGETVRVVARRVEAPAKDGQPADANAVNRQKILASMGLGFSADAAVRVPPGAGLDLHTAFGEVRVTNVDGKVQARTSSGAVFVTGGKGVLDLASDFGNLTIDGQPATVQGATKSGAVTVKGARGDVQVSSGFGNVTVDGAAAVTATTNSGAITVKRATGALVLKSGFGNVTADGAPAGATVETKSGAIRVTNAKGALGVTSGFGNVEAEGRGVTLRGRTSSGAIGFRGTLAEGEHTLHSDFGNVRVKLPADSRFRVDARTQFGRVTSAFAVKPTAKGDDKHLQGTVGDDPAVVLKLTTNSGAIELQKEK
jgi:DUF4097 and DUF4098 domain-containing protein YvlB